MLIIEIKAWPQGDKAKERLIHRGTIWNLGTGSDEEANYEAEFEYADYAEKRSSIGSIVTKFRRQKNSAWSLLYQALRPIYEEKPEDKYK
jgi:hypothetical protein